MSEENVAALKQVYVGWTRGDFRVEESLFDPYMVGVYPDPEPTPQYGLGAVREYMRQFRRTFDGLRFEATRFRAANGTVVVDVRRFGVGKQSGVTLEDKVFHVCTFADGGSFGSTYSIARIKPSKPRAAGVGRSRPFPSCGPQRLVRLAGAPVLGLAGPGGRAVEPPEAPGSVMLLPLPLPLPPLVKRPPEGAAFRSPMRWRGPESNWRHHDFQSRNSKR